MRAPRRKPDYEADSVEMTADSIKDKGHFHGRKTHGRNRAVAKGDIEVIVREQHPGKAADEGKRPPAGPLLREASQRRGHMGSASVDSDNKKRYAPVPGRACDGPREARRTGDGV